MANIQIVTTYDQGSYSACEALWLEVAESTISRGHGVEVLLSQRAASHPRVQRLGSSGALLRFRRPTPQNPRAAVLHKAWQRTGARWTLARKLHSQPSIRILNVGTMLEAAMEPWATLMDTSDVPTAIIVHNNPEIRAYSRCHTARLASIMRRARRVYFVSDRLHQNAEEQLITRIPGAVTVRNPVNLDSRQIEPWPAGSDVLRFAVVGRLDAFVKGQIRLLHALSSVKWKSRQWELVFFGEGPDQSRIEQAAAFYGLEDRVHFGGFVRDVRADIWRNCHALVMPSMLEGMPLALVEAMLCGRPAVCSDVGGASELIRHGENGFLSESPFAKQVALAMESMWSNRARLREMGLSAHADATSFIPLSPGERLLDDLLATI